MLQPILQHPLAYKRSVVSVEKDPHFGTITTYLFFLDDCNFFGKQSTHVTHVPLAHRRLLFALWDRHWRGRRRHLFRGFFVF